MTLEEIQAGIAASKGHSIPYHYNSEEITKFVSKYSQTATLYPPLVEYLRTGLPSWGIIVDEAYGQILVWRDAARVLHVVDVTNMRIAQSVKKAPFESPDSSVFLNLRDDFAALFSGIRQAIPWVSLACVAIAGAILWKKV